MVIIETIKNLIRPGTLAVRLTANIIAGHLLLTLLGNPQELATYLLFHAGFSLHTDTTPPQPNHNVTPTHIEPEQYNP